MKEWLRDNWYTLAVFAYACLSEIVGMSKLQHNSVVQMIMAGLGKIFNRR